MWSNDWLHGAQMQHDVMLTVVLGVAIAICLAVAF
jgi:hypothetical protein